MNLESASCWAANEKEFSKAKGGRQSLWVQACQFAEKGAKLYAKT